MIKKMLSISHYIALNVMTGAQPIWGGHGRNLPWNNFRYYAGISLEGLRQSISTLSQDS
jgi:hypothetical protein